MKKLFLPTMIISFAASSALFSNTIKINNTTSSTMKVEIEYVGQDVCSPDKVSISPNSRAVINAKGCCTKPQVRFLGMSGDLQGKTIAYDPPRTGLSLSCRGWNAEIKPMPGTTDTFAVETRN
jgi:hypothetical protein